MPIAALYCPQCGKTGERLEITSADRAEPLPECCGGPMERGCGSTSFATVTMRGNLCKWQSNRPPVYKNRGPRGI